MFRKSKRIWKVQITTLRKIQVRGVVVVLIFSHLLMVGCATRTSQIAPSYVSMQTYAGMSCETASEELRRLSSEFAVLSAKQNSTATTDTVSFWIGMFVLWPVIFVPVFTGDEDARIGELKGQQLALDSHIADVCQRSALDPSVSTNTTNSAAGVNTL